MRAVHERVRGERPGMLDRPGAWWDARLYDPESERKGAQPLQALVVPDGYALYAVRADRDDEGPAGEVRIRELVAATPAARALLWDFLLDQDLTRTVAWPLAPRRRAAVADAHRPRRRARRPRGVAVGAARRRAGAR